MRCDRGCGILLYSSVETMRIPALLSVLSFLAPMLQSGSVLSNEAVGEAITLGLRGSKFTPVSCRAGMGRAGFHVEVMGPRNRIQLAALAARQRYLGFALADVTDEMRAVTLSISAMPLREIAMPGATHVVLKSQPPRRQSPIVLQPLSYRLHPTGWGNRKSAGISAIFDLGAFEAIPHKDVDVVTITDSGEARCKMSEGMRRRIA